MSWKKKESMNLNKDPTEIIKYVKQEKKKKKKKNKQSLTDLPDAANLTMYT